MIRNIAMTMKICLLLMACTCEAATLLNSGTLQFLQNLGLDTGGSVPDITLGEKIRQSDSPIYYIKLPPVPYYYVNNNLFNEPAATTPSNFEKVAIDFTSNGRPDQIYHWNKPSTAASDHWSFWKTSTTQVPTTTTTTPAPTTTTTTTPKPVKKPWLTLDKYFPYNGRPSGIYIYKPRPSMNHHKFKSHYFTHFNY